MARQMQHLRRSGRLLAGRVHVLEARTSGGEGDGDHVALAQDAWVVSEVRAQRICTLRIISAVRRHGRRDRRDAHVLGTRHQRRLGRRLSELDGLLGHMRRQRVEMQRDFPHGIERRAVTQVLQQHRRHIRLVKREGVACHAHTDDARLAIWPHGRDGPVAVKESQMRERSLTHKHHTLDIDIRIVAAPLPCLDRIAHELGVRHEARAKGRRRTRIARQEALVNRRWRRSDVLLGGRGRSLLDHIDARR